MLLILGFPRLSGYPSLNATARAGSVSAMLLGSSIILTL
jgi:hypothetical protein